MVGGRIRTLEQPQPEGREGTARSERPRRTINGTGFKPTEWLVAVATIVLMAGTAAWGEGPAEPDCLARALAAVRDEMAKSPAPWPQAWQEEYVDTIRKVALAHRDSPGYGARMEILGNGFAPYWEAVPKNDQRSLFEVRQAEIRWYVENLMSGELPTDSSKKKLCEQYKSLVEYAADALLTQFPFLDPSQVRLARADHLRKCCRLIESPLLPAFFSPFTEAQVGQLKERWTKLRYARVDLWRQLGGGAASTAKPAQVPPCNTHPDYLLTERSLDQLRGQVWSLIAAAPEYYRSALAREADAQRERLRLWSEARSEEERLGVAVLQSDYVSFLLTALLETLEASAEAGEG